MQTTLSLLSPWLGYFLGRSLLYGALVSFILTGLLYLYKGAVALDRASLEALWLLFKSFFSLALAVVSFPILVTSIKTLHNRCKKERKVIILGCDAKPLERLYLEDAFKVARRWLVLSMWILIVLIVIISALNYVVNPLQQAIAWMNVTSVYPLFVVSTVMAFFLLLHRCKKVDIVRC